MPMPSSWMRATRPAIWAIRTNSPIGGLTSVLSETPPTEISHHLAMDDLAVGAREFGEAFAAGAFVTAQHAVVHQALVEEKRQLLGRTFPLAGGARPKETPKPSPSRRTTVPSKRPRLST